MVLYHRNTDEAAAAILAGGFKDSTKNYLTDSLWTGVWLSNVPLDVNEGAQGRVLLEVTLSLGEDDLGEFEWIEEGKPYREWLVPAAVINPSMSLRIVNDDEDDQLRLG